MMTTTTAKKSNATTAKKSTAITTAKKVVIAAESPEPESPEPESPEPESPEPESPEIVTVSSQSVSVFQLAGTIVSEATNMLQAIQSARLDWDCVENDVYYHNGSKQIIIEGQKVITRSDNGGLLNICNSTWTPVQNRDCFNFFDQILSSGIAKLDTVLSLNEGKRIAITAEVANTELDVLKNDSTKMYIVLFNGHDGTLSLGLMYTPIRVICQNTLSLALESTKGTNNTIRLRHTSKVNDNFAIVQENMLYTIEAYKKSVELYQSMAHKSMSSLGFRNYISVVFEQEYKEKISNYKYFGTLLENFDNGIGSDIPGVRGTIWAGYQAATQLITHQLGERKNKVLNTDSVFSTRANSLLFGKGSLLTRSAMFEAQKLLVV
jgi:phage/plasmid-like protein (TIGR03299 family)